MKHTLLFKLFIYFYKEINTFTHYCTQIQKYNWLIQVDYFTEQRNGIKMIYAGQFFSNDMNFEPCCDGVI